MWSTAEKGLTSWLSFVMSNCEFESTCVLFLFFCSFLPLYDCLNSFIIDLPRPLSNGIWIILFQMVDV